MPSMVAEILDAAELERAGVVTWGTRPSPPEPATSATGIYVVALTEQLESLDRVIAAAPISAAAVDELLAARSELTLDGLRPTPKELIDRLASFWFPDEVVLYIGLAGPRKSRP